MGGNLKKKKKRLLNTRYSFLKIMTGSDLSSRRLPFMMAQSPNPGPVLWLTGCVHGDEIGGVVVIQEIFKRIRRRLVRGSVYSFPLMNPLGFESLSRDITMSKEDLNRSFPGNASGSLAERIAEKIFSTIKRTKPTLVLDLHNDWRGSIPYVLLDSGNSISKSQAYERSSLFASKCGFLVVNDIEDAEGTLSYSLLKENIPSFTLELGEDKVVNEKNIDYGVKSIWSLLKHLGMIDSSEEDFTYPLPEAIKNKKIKGSFLPLSSRSGIVRFLASPGSIVKKGQPIARVYNAFGKLLETVNCVNEGIVLGLSDSAVAFPGSPLMFFGIQKTAEKTEQKKLA